MSSLTGGTVRLHAQHEVVIRDECTRRQLSTRRDPVYKAEKDYCNFPVFSPIHFCQIMRQSYYVLGPIEVSNEFSIKGTNVRSFACNSAS